MKSYRVGTSKDMIGSYNRKLIVESKNIDNIFPSEAIQGTTDRAKKAKKCYPPGSCYEGEWEFGHTWDGKGRYTFPHGVTYEGDFIDSQFHGFGVLRYPMGQTLKAQWLRGKMIKWEYSFEDGLVYREPWGYCHFPKRTYQSTLRAGSFKPPGKERITNATPPRPIPKGCYDVGEGFYNPKLSCIVSATEDNKIMRIPTAVEANWIKKHCRCAEEGNVGYRPDLYEYWCSGTQDSVQQIIEILENEKWEKGGE